MEWFVNAATPFQGMEINVLSEVFQPIPMVGSSYKGF